MLRELSVFICALDIWHFVPASINNCVGESWLFRRACDIESDIDWDAEETF